MRNTSSPVILLAILNMLFCYVRLITIFDCKVELEWTGTTSDGNDVKGKLTIPEVSHEITVDGLSDYQVCPLVS
jgi:activator of HSP90 ATPase